MMMMRLLRRIMTMWQGHGDSVIMMLKENGEDNADYNDVNDADAENENEEDEDDV